MRLVNKNVKREGNYEGIIDVELNQALLAAKKNFGFREKEIFNDLKSVEVNSHVYPGDRYITANLYDSLGDGFQIIVRHETDGKVKRKPGEITN